MLEENVKVTMGDGSDKKICEMHIGDLVTSAGTDGDTHVVKIEDIVKGSEDTMVLLTTCNGIEIIMTQDHPVLTMDAWVRVKNLKEGDCMRVRSEYDNVKTITTVRGIFKVYDLVLEAETGYYANGLGAGSFRLNMGMQKTSRYLNEDPKYNEETKKIMEELRSLLPKQV